MSEGTTLYCGDNCNHTGPHRYPPVEREVIYVYRDAYEDAVRERDELREAARDHVNAECRCGNGGSHDLTCDLIVTEDALRAALHREDGV